MLCAPAVIRQSFVLRLNGQAVFEGQASRNEVCTFSCEVPAGIMSFDGINLLEVLHEDGAAPASIANSADRRILSLRFVSLFIESRDPLELEKSLSKSRPLFLITGLALPGQRPMLELPRILGL